MVLLLTSVKDPCILCSETTNCVATKASRQLEIFPLGLNGGGHKHKNLEVSPAEGIAHKHMAGPTAVNLSTSSTKSFVQPGSQARVLLPPFNLKNLTQLNHRRGNQCFIKPSYTITAS